MSIRAQSRYQFDLVVVSMIVILASILVLVFISNFVGGGGLSLQAPTTGIDKLGKYVGAGLAIGLAALGAGLAIGIAGAAGFSAMAEKPELFGRVFLIIVLAEGLGIYGLIVAILLIILG